MLWAALAYVEAGWPIALLPAARRTEAASARRGACGAEPLQRAAG